MRVVKETETKQAEGETRAEQAEDETLLPGFIRTSENHMKSQRSL